MSRRKVAVPMPPPDDGEGTPAPAVVPVRLPDAPVDLGPNLPPPPLPARPDAAPGAAPFDEFLKSQDDEAARELRRIQIEDQKILDADALEEGLPVRERAKRMLARRLTKLGRIANGGRFIDVSEQIAAIREMGKIADIYEGGEGKTRVPVQIAFVIQGNAPPAVAVSGPVELALIEKEGGPEECATPVPPLPSQK